jgi:hypothetical protein
MNWSEVSGYLFVFAVASHHLRVGNSAAFSGERSGGGSTFGVWTGFAAPAWSGLGSMIVGQVPCHCEFSHCIRPKEVRPLDYLFGWKSKARERHIVFGPKVVCRSPRCAWLRLMKEQRAAQLRCWPLCHCAIVNLV